MEDVCVELLDPHSFLRFCAQMQKSDCNVLAVNTFGTTPFVWLENSPQLQTYMVPMANNHTCAGYDVHVHEKRPKGAVYQELRDRSYYDLERFAAEHKNVVKSWSPPTCFDARKKTFK